MSIVDFLAIDEKLTDKLLLRILERWKEQLNQILFFVHIGSGTPENAEIGDVGHIFLRTNGGANTTLYVKESGNGTNTGWIAK